MRLPPQETITAFDKPSVRNWLVVFICGFLTVCIVSPVVCTLLWVLRWVLVALDAALPSRLLDVPLPYVIRLTLLLAVGFGALLATMMVLELARRKRQEFRIKGHHPVIGDYEHSPYYKRWRATPLLPSGVALRLDSQGSAPTDAQGLLWQQFIARYDSLSAKLHQALLTPPHPLEGCTSITLTPDSGTLTDDGRLHLSFLFSTIPDAFWNSEVEEPIPVAVLNSALELEKTEWITPRS